MAGSRGLGRATAEALAAEGVRVMLSSRSAESLAEAEAGLRAAGADVATRAADIADPACAGRLVEATVADLRHHRHRGRQRRRSSSRPRPRRRRPDDRRRPRGQPEVGGPAGRAAVPVMRANGWGRICCITSYSVVQPIPGLALSNMARAGLWAWAKTAAQDLAAEESGITLNLLCPGPHATDRMRELGGAGRDGGPGRLRPGGRVPVLAATPGSSTGRHWWSTAGRPWPCRDGPHRPIRHRGGGGPDPSVPGTRLLAARLVQKRRWTMSAATPTTSRMNTFNKSCSVAPQVSCHCP